MGVFVVECIGRCLSGGAAVNRGGDRIQRQQQALQDHDGRRARARRDDRVAALYETIACRAVLSAIDLQGWTDEPPAAVVCANRAGGRNPRRVVSHACRAPGSRRGGRRRDHRQSRGDAAERRVAADQINAQYKDYRKAQMAKAGRATPYSVFIQRFTETIVRDAAASGRSAFLP